MYDLTAKWKVIGFVVSYQLSECSFKCWDLNFNRQEIHMVVQYSIMSYLSNAGSKLSSDKSPLNLLEQDEIVDKLLGFLNKILGYL